MATETRKGQLQYQYPSGQHVGKTVDPVELSWDLVWIDYD